jgi:hypothetical protein
MALKHACRLNFGKFHRRSVEDLIFDPDGYEFLYHFSRRQVEDDDMASLRAFVRRVLALADAKPVVSRTCDCGHIPKFGKYYAGGLTYFEGVYCDHCRPSQVELGQAYWLVPLVFSSQRQFHNPYDRKRFVAFLTMLVGMPRPVTALKAFAFFFPEEAAAQQRKLDAQIPESLRQQPPRQRQLELLVG